MLWSERTTSRLNLASCGGQNRKTAVKVILKLRLCAFFHMVTTQITSKINASRRLKAPQQRRHTDENKVDAQFSIYNKSEKKLTSYTALINVGRAADTAENSE